MIPHWLRGRRRPPLTTRPRPALPATFRPRFEPLEDRTTPATLHWTGATSSAWSNAANWAENAVPGLGDTLVFDTTTPGFAGTAAAFAPTNDVGTVSALSIVINDASAAGNFAVGGSGIGLSLVTGTAISSTVSVGAGAALNLPITLGVDTTINVGLGTLTVGGVIGGTARLTQASTPGATLALTGANTYSGGTTVAGGTLVAGNNAALGTGHLTLAGGTLAVNAFTTLTNGFTVIAPSTIAGGGVDAVLSGNGVLNAPLSLAHVGFLYLDGALSGPGGLVQNGFPGHTTLRGTQSNTFTGGVSILGGELALAKTGGAISVATPITLGSNGGTFPLLTLVSSDQIADTVGVTLGAFSRFNLNGRPDTIASLSGTGTLDTSALTPPAQLTVAGGGNQVFGGAVTGSGTVRYTGAAPSTFTLSGASGAFTGTLVNAGTGALFVVNDFSQAVVQATAGLVGGNGVVKSVTATTGAILTPAGPGSAGLLSTAAGANATTLGGAAFGVDLASPIPLDQFVLGANATIDLTGATLLFALLPGPAPVSSYTIISSATGGITGTFTGLPNNTVFPIAGQPFRINYSANAVTLTNTNVPTPTVRRWTGAVSSAWSNAANWAENAVPVSGNALVFDTTTTGFAGTAAAFAPNNDIAGLTNVTVSINDASAAGDFVIGGGGIGLPTFATTAIVSSVSVGTRATVSAPLTLAANTGFASGYGTLTLGGVISGGFQVAQASPPNGIVELTAANTYTGGTTIPAGTLVAGNNAALGTGPLTLSGGTLSLGAFTTLANPFGVSAPSTITGTGQPTLTGAGTLNATLTSTHTGFLNLNGPLGGTGGLVVNGFPGNVVLGGTQANTFNGPVTVAYGTLVLAKPAGVTAIGGPLTLQNQFAAVSLSNDNQIGDNVAVTIQPGGAFNLNNRMESVLSLNGGTNGSFTATLNTGTATPPTLPGVLTVVGGGVQSYGGAVAGNGAVVYAGTGSLTLTGASAAYAGLLSVATGRLAVSADFSGASVQVSGGTATGTGVVRTAFDSGAGGTVNPGGVAAGGLLSVAPTTAALALDGLTYQVDVSTVVPSDQLVLGNTATLNLTGAALAVNVLSSATGRVFTIVTSATGGITGTFNGLPENATFTAGGRTFRINYTPNVVTLTDVPGGPALRRWTGAVSSLWSVAGNWAEGAAPTSGSTVTFDTATPGFAGTAAAFAPVNDIAGLTGLTVTITDASAAGNFAITGNAIGLSGTGTGLSATVTAGTTATVGLPVADSGFTVSVAGTTRLALTGVIAGSGDLTLTGGGILVLGGANTYTGDTILSAGLAVAGVDGVAGVSGAFGTGAGTVFMTGGGPAGVSAAVPADVFNPVVVNSTGFAGVVGDQPIFLHAVTLASRLSVFNTGLTEFGTVQGAGAEALLIDAAAGVVRLTSGSSTYAGATRLVSGTLVLAADSTGAAAGVLGNPDSGVLELAGGELQAALTVTAGNDITVTAPSVIGGNSVLNLTGDGTLSALLTVTNGNVTTLSGALSGAGGLTMNSAESSLWLAGNAANTMTGPTTALVGTIHLNKAAGVDAVAGPLATAAGAAVVWQQADQVADAAAVTTAGGLSLNGFADTIGSLAGPATGEVLLTEPGSSLTVGADNTTTAFAGRLVGEGTLTKVGTGTLTLTGNNPIDFTGTTTVTAGVLAVNGSNPDGPAAVTGGTLAGTGTVRSIAATGGTVAPGGVGTVGTLSTAAGATTLAGSTLRVDVADPAAADRLAVGAGATVNLAGAALDVTVLGSAAGNVYTIVGSTTGGIGGEFAGLPNGSLLAAGGRTFRIDYSATAVTLTDVTTPTPSLTIDSASATVGTSGTTPLTFTVTLSAASLIPVTVNYATANGTAVAPGDYAAASGTLTFAPGVTSQTITVLANGTATFNLPKSFTVVLSAPTNATISSGTGTGTINYSAPAPSLSIGNAAATVGTSGTTPLTFTVTLSAASGATTTVNYTTANGSAVSPADYASASGTLTFAPGVTTQTVTVLANGTATFNLPKSFTVVLSAPTNATVGSGTGTGTISYSAPAPAVSINSVAATVGTSGTTPLTFTVSLSAASGATTTVNYTTADGSAVSPADYAATSGTLTFAPGQTTQTVTVLANGTTAFNLPKQFTVVLSAPTNATINAGTGTGTINNPNPAPALTVGNAAATVGTTGTTPLTFTVSLSAASGATTTVNYTTVNGSAVAPADYTAASGTLTYAPGQTTRTITVLANGTPLFNPAKSFTVVLSSPTNATITSGTGTGTITYSAPAPSVSIGDAAVTVGTSGTTPLTFTLTLSAASGATTTVNYTTVNGTAVAPADYIGTSGSVTFAPGQTTRTVTVQANGTTAFGPAKQFAVVLSSPTNATIGGGTGTGTINNPNPAPAVTIGDSSVTVGTSGTAGLTFTVSLSAASGATTTVNFATADGSAVAPGDYAAASGTLTFAPGQTTQTITVFANGTTTFNPAKTLTVTLSAPTNASIGGTGTGTGTITYSAPAPAVSIGDAAVTVGTSGTTPLTFTLTLSAPSGATTTVNYTTVNGSAVAPADYAAASGTVTFAPGETAQTITVLANGTAAFNPAKTFGVNLSAPTNATLADASATGTITNPNPAPAITISDAAATVGTGGTTPLTFTVSLSAPSGATTRVRFETANGSAAAPQHYATAAGILTFNPGETSKTITVQANGTPVFGPAREFSVVLTNPSNATLADASATGTITNPNPAPALAVDSVTAAQGAAGTGTVTFTVTLAGGTTLPATVDFATADGTAVAGTDYTPASGTLTFAPGQTTQTVPVTVLGNPAFAAARTFTLTLTNPSNATLGVAQGVATLTGTRTATAIAAVSGGGQSAAVGAGFVAPLVVRVTDQFGNPVAGVAVTFAGPAAGPGVTFPAGATAVTAADGTAAVAVAAGGDGGAYTVTATAAGVATPAAFGLTNTVAPPAGGPLVVSGSPDGAARVFAPDGAGGYNPTPTATVRPFGGFTGDVRAAGGDFDADGIRDTVLVTGAGVKTVMAVVSGRDGSTLLAPADPFGDANFTFGGFVTAGDIDGDGRAEWVVTPELRGGPRVIIFRLNPADPRGFDVVGNFFGIQDASFRDGARAALGDVNRDGTLDVFAIAAFNGGPRTALFDGADVLVHQSQGRAPNKLTGDFFAAPSGADEGRGGRSIAAGDVTGDGVADFIASGDNLLGTGNQVTVFSGADLTAGRFPGFGASPVASFFVGGAGGGSLVSVGTVNADSDARADLAVGSGAGQPGRVRVYRGTDLFGAAEPAGAALDPFDAITPSGVFVG